MTPAELRARGAKLFPALASLDRSPLEQWTLPATWPLRQIWVKRDDALGEGGTKLRKLRVELARPVGRGVLTFGYLDSNHALVTARLAAAVGLTTELEILGQPSQDPPRATLLRTVAHAHFHRTALGLLASAGLRLAWHRLRGTPLQLLPPGGTTAASTAAVALAVGETLEQLSELGVEAPARWAVAVGSGGTLAGLWAGVRALGLSVRPYGAAASSRLVGPRRVARLANRALILLGSEARVRAEEVEVDLTALGAGHAAPTVESLAALDELGSLGERLDPIFTAKAMAGLRARATAGEGWLFWHSGLSAG